MTDPPDEPLDPGMEVVLAEPEPPPEEEPVPPPESDSPEPTAEGMAFDGSAREIEAPARRNDNKQDAAADASDAANGSDGDDSTADYRNDFFGRSRIDIGGDAEIGMIAGGDIHYHQHGGKRRRASGQRVDPGDLAKAEACYVSTGTEPELRSAFNRAHLAFLRVRAGSGGGTTAFAVLDELTERNRQESRVRRLSPADPHVLSASVDGHVGLLVDTLGTDWASRLRRSAADELASELRKLGSFMVVLVDADVVLPVADPVVHQPPDTAEVFGRYLAFLQANRPGGAVPSRAAVDVARREELPGLIKEMEEGPPEAQEWYAAIRSPGTPPREGVIFAQEWWNWRLRRAKTGEAEDDPPFPRRSLTEQARNLLRRKSGSDNSPVRQAYVIAAAVLDDVPMSDIADRAGQLAAGFSEIERPGAGGRREVFGEPFRSWLEQLSAGTSPSSGTNPVWRRQRELAREVIEVAWSDYDIPREPLRKWLVDLCEQGDKVQRVRAVQALALIAAKDYRQVQAKVLRDWARSQKTRHHECAAWLLEAMILFGVPALRRKAEGELRFFSRSRHRSERAVALRTYGTRITDQDRIDGALEAVHASIGVLGGRFGQLIPQCLRDLYELGHREQVLTFLVRRVRQYPSALVQGQVARTVVGIARLRVRGGGHDLLRFASTLPRDATGEGDVLSPDAVAELWWYACDQFRTRTEAWQVLGRWHADCVAHPELMPTFDELLDAMARIDRPERSADDRPLRTRIGLYREFWKKKAMEREQ